jgi:hypothetical protein
LGRAAEDQPQDGETTKSWDMVELVMSVLMLWTGAPADTHPLKLSLCDIEYSSAQGLVQVSLRLFLTDINEALVFDPYSNELSLGQPNESPKADQILLNYLNGVFYVRVNGEMVALSIERKDLTGEGEDTVLWVYFEAQRVSELKSLEIRNAIFTDIFYGQNNIVYVHRDDQSKSLRLNGRNPVRQLNF